LEARTPKSSKLAGGLLMAAGACAGITGLEAMLFQPAGLLGLIPPILVMLSGGCLFAGFGVVRRHETALRFALVLAGVTAAVALAWGVVAYLNGVVSSFALVAVPLALAAATLVAIGSRAPR
jgi:hypothetical protein